MHYSEYIGFRLAPELKAKLVEMAHEDEKSAGEILRKLLRQATVMPKTHRSPSLEVSSLAPQSEAREKGSGKKAYGVA